jgi:16S rRNA G966 N2-methylase RsmD
LQKKAFSILRNLFGNDGFSKSEKADAQPINTLKTLAAEIGTSAGNFHKMETIKKSNPELWKAVKKDEISIDKAHKQVKQEEKKEIRAELAAIGAAKTIDLDLRLGDFEDVLADIPDGSIDCIITDPPYPFEFIECWSKLSRFAKRVLKPHGFCIAYSGQTHLPEVIKRMSENMDYYWTFCVYHKGQTQIVPGAEFICRWKPVLIFQNGKKHKQHGTFEDYFISEQREKGGHDWQQSESGIKYLIEMFTMPGDKMVEPFAGAGTTLKVAVELGRSIVGAEIDEETYNIAKSNLK